MGPAKPLGALVVGNGPSREDVKNGEPLTGNTGAGFEEALAEAGLSREDIKIIPAWACQGFEPRKDKDERKATLSCRPLVQATLAQLDPRTPVFLAGKWAQLSVDGRERGLFTRRGFRDDKWKIGDPLHKEADDETDPDTPT